MGDEVIARFTDAGRKIAAAHANGQVGVGDGTDVAPEVFDGGPATQKSDQWRYAMAIWRALGGTPDSQPVSASPHLASVLRRALDGDPAKRWPSVDAMVRAFQPSSAWLWIGLVTTAMVFAAGIAIVVYFASRQHDGAASDGPCFDLKGQLDGVWDAPHRDEIMRHFTDAPGVAMAIERYTVSWLTTRDKVCRDPAASPLQARCLDTHLKAVRETVHLLPKTSSARALEIVEALPTIEDCGDVAHLVGDPAPPPVDTDEAYQLRLQTAELDAAEATWTVDRDASVMAVAERIAKTSYAPLRARALFLVASVQRSKQAPATVATLHAAATAAADAHDELMQAQVATALVDTHAFAAPSDKDRAWQIDDASVRIAAITQFAPAMAARLRLDLLDDRFRLHLARHDVSSAVTDAREIVELAEQQWTKDSWHAAQVHDTLATALVLAGQFEAAVTEVERTTPIIEKQLGRRDVELAKHYGQAALAYHFAGNDPRALELLAKARQLSMPVADEIANFELSADVVMTQGGFVDGISFLERALAQYPRAADASNKPRVDQRLVCAKAAQAVTRMSAGDRRELARIDAAECFLADRRWNIVVPLIDAGLAARPGSKLEARERFIVAKALSRRGRSGDAARATVEAKKARSLDASLAKEIASSGLDAANAP